MGQFNDMLLDLNKLDMQATGDNYSSYASYSYGYYSYYDSSGSTGGGSVERSQSKGQYYMLLKSFKSGSYWVERAVTDIVPNVKKLLCNNVDTFTSKSLGSSQASWNIDSRESAGGGSYGSGGLPRARLATIGISIQLL